MCWQYYIVGCLARTWCKRGVALVKFQTIPMLYGIMGHVYMLMRFTGHICIDPRQSNRCYKVLSSAHFKLDQK